MSDAVTTPERTQNGLALAGRTAQRRPDGDVVDGEITRTVRVVRFLIAASVISALVAGAVRGATSGGSTEHAVISGMYLCAAGLGAILILLGSLVEGFGFGLSLGTHWPYTRNIIVLLIKGDPEAAHRIVATLLGLMAVVLVVLVQTPATISGLGLIVATALLGIGTLHVLAGRLPSLVHGTHGLLAYGVLLCYLSSVFTHHAGVWSYFIATVPLHPVFATVLLGGTTTGQRGFGKRIGTFSWPRRTPHWIVSLHILLALSVIAALGSQMPTYAVAFYLAVAQVAVGFLLFHAVNLKPKSPGILVGLHQLNALAIMIAIVATTSH